VSRGCAAWQSVSAAASEGRSPREITGVRRLAVIFLALEAYWGAAGGFFARARPAGGEGSRVRRCRRELAMTGVDFAVSSPVLSAFWHDSFADKLDFVGKRTVGAVSASLSDRGRWGAAVRGPLSAFSVDDSATTFSSRRERPVNGGPWLGASATRLARRGLDTDTAAGRLRPVERPRARRVLRVEVAGDRRGGSQEAPLSAPLCYC
jgi:hypothetical protein